MLIEVVLTLAVEVHLVLLVLEALTLAVLVHTVLHHALHGHLGVLHWVAESHWEHLWHLNNDVLRVVVAFVAVTTSAIVVLAASVLSLILILGVGLERVVLLSQFQVDLKADLRVLNLLVSGLNDLENFLELFLSSHGESRLENVIGKFVADELEEHLGFLELFDHIGSELSNV